MKIVFMGTSSFALPTLEALIKAEHEIPLVVTQPDRPRGRGKRLSPTPVKNKALEMLEDFPDNEARHSLQALIEFAIRRKS